MFVSTFGFGAVNVNVQYLYRTDGVKVRKSYNNIVTDYLGGFQYENGILKFLPTAEGYYDFENNAYIYHYKDHLGEYPLELFYKRNFRRE